MPQDMPQDAQDIIRKLLILNPEDRLGSQNIYDIIQHPFFKDIDVLNAHNLYPPEKLELNKQQQVMMKYLPKYRKTHQVHQRSTTP